MKRFALPAALIAALSLSGCATTGPDNQTDFSVFLCSAAGALVGGVGAAAMDGGNGGVAAGAAVGAGLAYLACREDEPAPEPMQDFDTDRDGVMDSVDACPGTLPQLKVDARGCPMDTDGDGVYDGLDRCPGTPAGAPVDEYGCEFDSDGDGVVDSKDQCPGTLAGVTVDERGCPEPGQMLVSLEGVNFELNSAKLKPSAMSTLDGAVKALMKASDVGVSIEGHTDSTGSDSYNKTLSQKRAAAVRDYLVAGGVAASRLSTMGYGEERPVASNDTPAGRAANRRVDLLVK